ncbi:MAG TPA: YidB family protein [Pirellulales bacterium]|jgi:uncharacterized protein YidB (DUF937 family)|nr:YidB family protein [Pirellulales bacterium]
MGLLDNVETSVAHSVGRQFGGALVNAIVHLLRPNSATNAAHTSTAGGAAGGGLGGALGGLAAIGGLAGLVKLFRDRGLLQLIESWVGKGPNQPITTNQLHQVLGDEHINALAAHLGTTPEVVLDQLKEALPAVVNHVTPNGVVPADDELASRLA